MLGLGQHALVAHAQPSPPESPTPQAQATLPRMLEMEWSAAPPMPQGMQDNDGGIIDHYLVMVGGFCHGIDDDWRQLDSERRAGV